LKREGWGDSREKEERILSLNLERERKMEMKEKWPLWA
jgi:hypothetical protein